MTFNQSLDLHLENWTNSRGADHQLFMPFLAQKPIDDDYRNVEIFRCPSYPDKEQTVCYVVNGWGGESDNGWRMQSVPVRCKVRGREVDIPNFKSQMLLCEVLAVKHEFQIRWRDSV